MTSLVCYCVTVISNANNRLHRKHYLSAQRAENELQRLKKSPLFHDCSIHMFLIDNEDAPQQEFLS